VMKRRDLVARIAKAAKATGKAWQFARQGAAHEIWVLDGKQVSIPRHNEINELTAVGVFRHFEDKLGKDWWK
jgi:hypothetical protein